MTSYLAMLAAQRGVAAVALSVASTHAHADDGDARLVGEAVTVLVIVALIILGRGKSSSR